MLSMQTLSMIGPTGAILVVLFIISLYLSLRSGIYLHVVGRDFYKYFGNLETTATCMHYVSAGKHNPLTGIINDIVQLHAKQPNIDIKEEIRYFFYRNFEHITKRLSYLRFISVVSPLLGLLGTMLGMVKVFQTIATEASPDSALLASGIWEALITTILGLCVAIPTLAFYYHLRLRLRALHIEAVEHSFHAIELCNSTTTPEMQGK